MHATLAAVAVGLVLVAGFSPLGWLVDRMVFHPIPGEERRPGDLGSEVRDVSFEAGDGIRLHAYLLPAAGSARALLFLHGNAGNASHRLPNAARLRALGTSVMVLNYRGYGRSEGRPSEEGVYRDARAALARLLEETGVREDRVVVFGRSLGGAVAVDLAQDRPLAGVILESTFSSAADVARHYYGAAGGFFAGDRFASEEKIGRVRAPLLFFHGDRDGIVPHELGLRLFERAGEPKAFETLVGAGHNDTVGVGGARYFERIGEFLAEVAPTPIGEDPDA